MAGPYAIFRIERHANAGTLAAASSHMTRARPTPNADASRSHLNRVLIGTADPAADLRRRRDEVDCRTNSGWGVEVLLTASPSWWRQASADQRSDWQDRSVRWLEMEFGRANIAHLRWHDDETSPHLTGFIVPTKPRPKARSGENRPEFAYSAEHHFGGKAKLSGLQDRYAAAVASLGLQRGIRNSGAEHTSIRDYYASLAAGSAVTPPTVPAPPLALTNGSRQRWADEQTERVAAVTRDLAARARDAGRERKRAGEMAEAARRTEERAKRAERVSDQVRDVPLALVLERWGLERDPADRNQWRAKAEDGGASARRITVQGTKWYDHAVRRGGGGAIDLVAHLGGMPPRDAIGWLAREHGVDSTARAVAAQAMRTATAIAQKAAAGPAPVLPVPEERKPSEAAWPRARRYLVERRRLPAELVDAEHTAGRLWADGRGSLVWPLTDEDGHRVGLEWRAARDARDDEERAPRGVVPGSRAAAGAYDLSAADPTNNRVLVVEGALDALAVRSLGYQGRVLGVAGTGSGRSLLARLAERLQGAVLWLIGLDADRSGDRASADLAQILPNSQRRRPSVKDWSEMLRQKSQAPSPPPEPTATPDAPEVPAIGRPR